MTGKKWRFLIKFCTMYEIKKSSCFRDDAERSALSAPDDLDDLRWIAMQHEILCKNEDECIRHV